MAKNAMVLGRTDVLKCSICQRKFVVKREPAQGQVCSKKCLLGLRARHNKRQSLEKAQDELFDILE